MFGDVTLSKSQFRKGNPGAGGWPTIRYFNKETGYEGGDYKKKTSEAMCTELGPGQPYMQQYVEEYGKTSLCSVKTEAGCSDKEKKFITLWKEKLSSSAKSPADVDAQISRLEGMAGGSMKEDLKQWIVQRLAIFKQLKTEL